MDDTPQPTLARIDAAIARIERAADATRTDRDGLRARHQQLRGEIADAIAGLDALIERGDAEGDA